MDRTEEIKDTIIDNMLSSYEDRIQDIGEAFQVERINNELKDILARNSSLRRKDFDRMMSGIFPDMELVQTYFGEQKEMAMGLRENLKKFKESLASGEAQRVQEFHDMIRKILDRQEERKNEVASKLREFREERQEMAKRLKELLAKGREIRIKDVKLMLEEFKNKRAEAGKKGGKENGNS